MSASGAEPEPARGYGGCLAPLLLVAATAAVYAQVAGHGFISLDDGSYITQNPKVRAGLTRAGLLWAFTTFHSANWHPLTWLAHMLDCQLFGLAAGGHHLVSAGLHALNACLCYWALRSLSAPLHEYGDEAGALARAGGVAPPPSIPPPIRVVGAPSQPGCGPPASSPYSWNGAPSGAAACSWLVALFFALHPLRVESVAWAAERKDVLAGTFFFATLLAYARYARAPSVARHLAVTASFVLGLLAKPMLVTLPLLLFLLDHWPLARPWTRRVWFEKLPWLALAAASSVVTVAAQRAGGTLRSLENLTPLERLSSATTGVVAYLTKTLWPVDLAVFYPHPALDFPRSFAPLGPRFLASAALLAGLSLLALRLARRAPAVLAGWLWTLWMLVPVLGLVQVGRQWIADRYAYLPLIGAYVAVVFGLRSLVPSVRVRRALYGAGVLVAGAFGTLAFAQVRYWRSSFELYQHAVAVAPENYLAQANLAAIYEARGEPLRAREHYEAALEVAPRQPKVLEGLAQVSLELGDRRRAVECLERLLRRQPRDVELHLWLGELLLEDGQAARAEELFAEALALAPRNARAEAGRARARELLGR